MDFNEDIHDVTLGRIQKYPNEPLIQMLRNNRNNPMIGGSGIIASPNALTISTDSSISSDVSDLDNIGDNIESIDNKRKLSFKELYDFEKVTSKNRLKSENDIQSNSKTHIQNTIEVTTKVAAYNDKSIYNNDMFINNNKIINNINSLDGKSNYTAFNQNQILNPLLIDFCNDVYALNTDEYLKENDLESILNEWPKELL